MWDVLECLGWRRLCPWGRSGGWGVIGGEGSYSPSRGWLGFRGLDSTPHVTRKEGSDPAHPLPLPLPLGKAQPLPCGQPPPPVSSLASLISNGFFLSRPPQPGPLQAPPQQNARSPSEGRILRVDVAALLCTRSSCCCPSQTLLFLFRLISCSVSCLPPLLDRKLHVGRNHGIFVPLTPLAPSRVSDSKWYPANVCPVDLKTGIGR